MADKIIPGLLIGLWPLDLLAGLVARQLPSQATLMSAVGTLLGLYLARRLWWGGSARLASRARLEFMAGQGRRFQPDSEEARAALDNSRGNYYLGAGFLLFGILLNLAFIGSYLVTTPIAAPATPAGQAVQLGILLIFTALVALLELFGANIFLKR